MKIFLFLIAAEGVLTGAAGVRSRLRGEPQEGFPRGDWPEIELETGAEKLKLYTDYAALYEAMLEEIERAESYVFFETFTFKVDEIGQRFVDALGRKAREGVRVYVVYDAPRSTSSSAGRPRVASTTCSTSSPPSTTAPARSATAWAG